MKARQHTQANLSLLREKLDSGGMRSAQMLIGSLHPSELARLLESLPLRERSVIWEMVDPENEGDVLVELADECGVTLPFNDPDELANYMHVQDARNLEDYLERFEITLSVMQHSDAMERIAYERCEDAAAENVR